MRVLNLYCGIGGNRKLWTDCEVTAVEYNESIAAIYKDLYPNDNVVVADAHQYLLEHYKEFDFIWSSPPCPTHSQLGLLNVIMERMPARYPSMILYEEIIFLMQFFKGKYCVENVKAYYEPLIKPQQSGRHHFWCNFKIAKIKNRGGGLELKQNKLNHTDRSLLMGYPVNDYHNYTGDKRQLFKNCVDSEIALNIFNQARGIIDFNKSKQAQLF